MLCPPSLHHCDTALSATPSLFFPLPKLQLLQLHSEPTFARERKSSSKVAGGERESAWDGPADEKHVPGSGRDKGKQDWGALACGVCGGDAEPAGSKCHMVEFGLC